MGRVVRAWGRGGEVKVEVLTDFPERFQPGQKLYLQRQVTTVERSHRRGLQVVLKLSTVSSREAAEELRDQRLEIHRSEVPPLPSGQHYHFELVGLEVWTAQGEPLGHITEVLSTLGNDIYVVEYEGQEILIPAIEDVVKSIDLRAGRLVIQEIEGLR